MDAVTRLEWIPPCERSLLQLARLDSICSWSDFRHDPGFVLLLIQSLPTEVVHPRHFSPEKHLQSVSVFEQTVNYLKHHSFANEVPERIRTACVRYASLAEYIAEQTDDVNPKLAWIAGLLAPLGWLALSVSNPTLMTSCLDDPLFETDPIATQRHHWNYDQSAIARRLCRQWKLPPWLSAICSHLGLQVDLAVLHGAERSLFQVVQLAVTLAQHEETLLGLSVGSTLTELYAQTGISVISLSSIPKTTPIVQETDAPTLLDLMSLAADNARYQQTKGSERLENEIDQLHQALEMQCQNERQRLHNLKLEGLAELAGGAGHEINNPLAVISGQAQYLLRKTEEVQHRKSLESIIAQTKRIHNILRELMQFARPSPPSADTVDLLHVVDEVGVKLMDFAESRKVRLQVRPNDQHRASSPVWVHVDREQLRTALTALFRNGIEHARSDGWVEISVQRQDGYVEVHVENSGPEMSLTQREHLFDPFYCGRNAGRGLGMGLPIAWALMRVNQGNVTLTAQPGERTRFVLQLPLLEIEGQSLSVCG